MNATELAREKALWLRTGEQDCANTIDVAELREDLGSANALQAAKIKVFLLKDLKPADMSSALEFPDGSSDAQQQALLDAWASGWSARAARIVREHIDEEAADRVHHEPAGWYVHVRRLTAGLGPFATEREALTKALAVELDDSDK